MSELPVDENAPGPSRPLSDFMSPERFAEFNAETRRLRRELVREEEELAARRLPASTSNPDRAGVMHEVGGLGHVQAGRAEEQQHSGGDDGEADAIHGRQAQETVRPKAAFNA